MNGKLVNGFEIMILWWYKNEWKEWWVYKCWLSWCG